MDVTLTWQRARAAAAHWWQDLFDRGAQPRLSGPLLPDLWATLLAVVAGGSSFLDSASSLSSKWLGIPYSILSIILSAFSLGWCYYIIVDKETTGGPPENLLVLGKTPPPVKRYSYRPIIRNFAKMWIIISIVLLVKFARAATYDLQRIGPVIYGSLHHANTGQPLSNIRVRAFDGGVDITTDYLPTDDNGIYVVELERPATRSTSELIATCPGDNKMQKLSLDKKYERSSAALHPFFRHTVECSLEEQ